MTSLKIVLIRNGKDEKIVQIASFRKCFLIDEGIKRVDFAYISAKTEVLRTFRAELFRFPPQMPRYYSLISS